MLLQHNHTGFFHRGRGFGCGYVQQLTQLPERSFQYVTVRRSQAFVVILQGFGNGEAEVGVKGQSGLVDCVDVEVDGSYRECSIQLLDDVADKATA